MTRSLIRVEPPVPVPTSAEALAGTVPTFVVHRSYNYAAALPDLVTRAQRVCGTDAAVAVATRLPMQAPSAARDFLDSVPTATLRIADPEIHTLPGPAIAPHSKTLKNAPRYAYGAVPVPASAAAAPPSWVREVLDAQYNAGANVFLSASGWVGATHGTRQLATAMGFVDASRAELGADDPMFVNLTLDGAWLMDKSLRADLFQEIVESSEQLWWLRVMWPPLRPNPYSQSNDAALLEGYAELAEVAADERKVVFLPNSGLTGWVTTALGASGFSTGMSGAERAYMNQAPQAGGPGTAPKQRFFEKTVLHTLLVADRPPLTGVAGYQSCGCAYCGRLASGPWAKDQEQLHYLHNVAELTAALGRRGRKRTARSLVANADAFNASLTGAARLTGESEPKHLTSWVNLLK